MRRITVVTALVIGSLTLAGCSSGLAMSESAMDSGGEAAPASEGGFAENTADREVIVNGYMNVTVDDPAKAADKATDITESAGGRIDARAENAMTDTGEGDATLTLRLPSATLSQSLAKLKKLGELESLELTTSDVTNEVRDLDARISALDSSLTRLRALLRSATSIKDLITLEEEITSRQGELESLQAQQRSLGDQVSLATLELRFTSVADAPYDEPETFLSGLAAGWESFVAFVSAVLVVTGVLIPWLVFFGLIGLVVLVFFRRRRKAPVEAPEA